MTGKVRVFLLDDHEVVRQGVRSLLEASGQIEVVGEAANGRELTEIVDLLKPDVILTDIVMPVMDGLSAVRKIHQTHPLIGIIALSMFDQEHYIVDMLEAGALGYLLKDADNAEIMDAILSVYRQETYYCRNTSAKLMRMISKSRFNPYKNKPDIEFTAREIEIIKLICQEKTSKEIGKALFLSTRTVEGYRLRIFDKINVKSVAGIIIYAIKKKIYLMDRESDH